MKKFVEFSLYEYMDEHPTQQVRIMEGENLEAIEKASKEFAADISKVYSGGPTSFVKVWTREEAKDWINKNIAEIGENPSSEDKEWINTVEEAFYSCYADILD